DSKGITDIVIKAGEGARRDWWCLHRNRVIRAPAQIGRDRAPRIDQFKYVAFRFRLIASISTLGLIKRGRMDGQLFDHILIENNSRPIDGFPNSGLPIHTYLTRA